MGTVAGWLRSVTADRTRYGRRFWWVEISNYTVINLDAKLARTLKTAILDMRRQVVVEVARRPGWWTRVLVKVVEAKER